MSVFWLLVCLLACVIHGAQQQQRDPYKILQVPRKAGSRQIKKAFRQQSLKWHPDKHKENKDEAEARFKDIAWAHDILSNETLRQAFDQYGPEGVERVERGAPAAGSRGFPHMFQQGVPLHNFMFHGPNGAFYNMFEHSSGFQSGGPRYAEIDWFEDGPVELISPKNRLDIDEMNPHWPDVFFLFRDVDDSTAKTAKVINSMAEEMRSTLEFQAVDCRRSNELCGGLSRSKEPYEIHLVTQKGAREAIQSARGSPRRRAPVLLPPKKQALDALIILKWLLKHLPEDYEVLSSFSYLEKFCKDHMSSAHPTLVIVNDEEIVNVKLRKWITDSKFRVKFGVVPSTDTAFRRELIKKFTTLMPKNKILRPGYIVHIPDIEVLSPNTVEFVGLGIDETALDLTVAKYVGMKKAKAGVYNVAAKRMRPLTYAMMKRGTGACTKFDNKFCILYVRGKRNVDKSQTIQLLFDRVANDGMRLYSIDADKQATFLRAFNVNKEALIAYRPKRLKYIKMENEISEKNIETFFESVSDGTSILSKGIKLDTWPTVV